MKKILIITILTVSALVSYQLLKTKSVEENTEAVKSEVSVVQANPSENNLEAKAQTVENVSKTVTAPQYSESIADFASDRGLIGSAHNVFVGTVVKQSSTQDRGIGPETQFEVTIVENIKGSLSGNVTVNQEGGYRNGKLYVFTDGDMPVTVKDQGEGLLQPGTTYLFVTRYSQKYNWYTMNPYPTATAIISKETLPAEQLVAKADSNERVRALKAAYPNEILLDADVKNNNALNSYRSQQTKPQE